MTMADADLMLEWKNYPETRNFSIISQEPIKKEDHYKWLELHLQYFQIIHDSITLNVDDKGATGIVGPVGAIRIQDNEISIWVAKECWKHGIASKVLKQVSKEGMTAKIVDGNIASMRSFLSAGFKPIDYHPILGYYTFKK
jgi:RimJ/RimL family protein N-acetyltransferase